jgi:drug/metabolite transporter (DMT)-like permease
MSARFKSAPVISPQVGLVFGLFAISTASILIRFAQRDGAPSLVIAAYRLTFASLLLLPLALWRHRQSVQALTRREWLLAIVAGVFLGAHFGAWITSLAYTSVASSVVLVSTSPLLVALISSAVLREPLSRFVLIGMTIAMTGAVLIGLSDICTLQGCPPLKEFVQGPAFIGDLLALAGAVAIAIYYIFGRVLRASLSLVAYSLVTYSAAAITLHLTVLAARLPLTGYAPQIYVWLLLLALLPQLVGYSAINWALKYMSATYVSVTVLGEPVGSTVLAMFLLKEIPSGLKLAGGALILAGILIASWRTR